MFLSADISQNRLGASLGFAIATRLQKMEFKRAVFRLLRGRLFFLLLRRWLLRCFLPDKLHYIGSLPIALEVRST